MTEQKHDRYLTTMSKIFAKGWMKNRPNQKATEENISRLIEKSIVPAPSVKDCDYIVTKTLEFIRQEQGKGGGSPQVFTFRHDQLGRLRAFIKDGEPWFIACDLCTMLDLHPPRLVMGGVDDRDKVQLNFDRVSGYDIHCVNESGLISLLKLSANPNVVAVRRWVNQEITPRLFDIHIEMNEEWVNPWINEESIEIPLVTHIVELLERIANALENVNRNH